MRPTHRGLIKIPTVIPNFNLDVYTNGKKGDYYRVRTNNFRPKAALKLCGDYKWGLAWRFGRNETQGDYGDIMISFERDCSCEGGVEGMGSNVEL